MKPYPQAYVAFLAHFHGTRDYFECHELLEEQWKNETASAFKDIWHGLIQVAVSAYHERRGNVQGAAKMLEQAVRRLDAAQPELAGLDAPQLRRELRERLGRLRSVQESGKPMPFVDPVLPLEDPELLEQSRSLCESWGAVWNGPSDRGAEALVHRHKLRDRSDVIEERRKQLNMRRLSRGGHNREDIGHE